VLASIKNQPKPATSSLSEKSSTKKDPATPPPEKTKNLDDDFLEDDPYEKLDLQEDDAAENDMWEKKVHILLIY